MILLTENVLPLVEWLFKWKKNLIQSYLITRICWEKKRWVGSWGRGRGDFCMYRDIIYILYRVRSLCPHHKPDISLWVWPLGHDTDRLQAGHFQCHTDATSCTIYSKYNAISPYLIGYFPPLQFSKVPSSVPLHGKMTDKNVPWQISFITFCLSVTQKKNTVAVSEHCH